MPSIRAGHGYTRVSTLDEDLAIQRAALGTTGYGVVRAETASDSWRDWRTELQVLLDFVQLGDPLVVTRIDRLARSMKDLQDIVHEPTKHAVALRATDQQVDTGTAAGEALNPSLAQRALREASCPLPRPHQAGRAPGLAEA